ncbi:MAG: hypothetical protein HY300_20235 [Verrucomicrobia bacterium]|nr:hypothetical protein [Verrucomicrobiota bacterium]
MAAVIRTLVKARDTYKNTPAAADRAITAAQFAQLDDAAPASLLSRVLKEASDVDLAQAAQAPLTNQLSQVGARLTLFISHFHQVLDMGIARGAFADGARSYYGRDITAGSIPDLSTYDAVAEAAGKIISGEAARATAEGAAYVAMALPSAAETGTLRTQFTALRNSQQQAVVNTDQQREEEMALYPEAQVLAVDLCDTVEFFYRKDPDDGSRRTKCERWGVVYLFDAPPAPPAPNP